MGLGFIPWLIVIITVIVNIAFCQGVLADANQRFYNRNQVAFVAPIFWAAATLIGGVPIALIYWVIHHSTLRRD